MTLYDNIAFPLREHTRKSEREVRQIVLEKTDMVGLIGSERKLPGEISGGMRKRAGLARALVLDPQVVLFDEPDSGLDPVRTAHLNQLIVDLNARIGGTFLIVTHDITTARTVPDNIGLLYHRHLAMFGPREMLLSSEEPVVRPSLNAQRQGPIGMAEEKDADELAAEAASGRELPALPAIPPQLEPSDGIPRPTQRPPGQWCREHGVTPTPGLVRSPHPRSSTGRARVPLVRQGRFRPGRVRPVRWDLAAGAAVSNPVAGAGRRAAPVGHRARSREPIGRLHRTAPQRLPAPSSTAASRREPELRAGRA